MWFWLLLSVSQALKMQKARSASDLAFMIRAHDSHLKRWSLMARKNPRSTWTIIRHVLRIAKAILGLVLLVLEIVRKFKGF